MDSKVGESLERKVLGELSNVKAEPVSPTANLRLLTTLASNLKNASPRASHSKSVATPTGIGQFSDYDPMKLLPRKEKSLGLLCNKFLSLYPLTNHRVPQEISLDSTAKALGTEKRRIYDIINVLESLEMASKAGKNRYIWHGQNYLPGTLAKLKSLAIKLGLREQIQDIQKINKAYTGNFTDSSPYCFASTSESPGFEDGSNDAKTDSKDDKSLGVMCQKFIMLFLVSLKNGVINLDIAARVLITDSDQSTDISEINLRSRFKTKVRRLYDIANVLSAIGLIKKVSTRDGAIRKPVFKYTGPDVDYIDLDADTPVREGTRHSLIGMATPRRSISHNYLPRLSAIKETSSGNTFPLGSSTPFTERRGPRKRKLFSSEDKFCRTASSPCLDTSRPLERLDDSILQVVEMELQKLKSNELKKPKVCTKLFPRHNSDSCVSATRVSNESCNSFVTPERSTRDPPDLSSKKNFSTTSSATVQPVVGSSDENLVEKNSSNIRDNFRILNVPNVPSQDQITAINAPIGQSSAMTIRKVPKLKMRNPNILSTSRNIMTQRITMRDSLVESKKTVKIAPYKIQPRTSTPKFVNLSNFDANKLIPIKPSQLQISVPVIGENPIASNTSYAILTQVQTPVMSPGDLFKAVQVGNTLQLVPISNEATMIVSSEQNASDNNS